MAIYYCGTGQSQTTIADVNALSLVAGDSVLFNRGETFSDATLIAVSEVTYGSYGTGDKPIISKGIKLINKQSSISISDIEFNVSSTSVRAIQLTGCSNITIDNCLLDGKNIFNQVLLGAGHSDGTPLTNIIIKNCEVKNGGANGAYSVTCLSFTNNSYDITIDNCNIHDFYWLGIQIYSSDNTKPSYNLTAKNCTIYNTTYDDTGAGSEQVGINIGAYSKNCIVEKNYVYNVVCGIQCDAGSGIVSNIVKNNKVENCSRSIRIMSNSTYGASNNSKILNNTIIGSMQGLYGIFFYSDGTGQSTGNECKNNIMQMSDATDQHIRVQTDDVTIDSDKNCFYNLSGTYKFYYNGATKTLAQWQALGYDLNSISSDPLLTSAYKLTKDSPCVDAGETLSDVTDDYEGTPRPIGTSSDIGAYEYYSKKICNAEIKNI